MNSEPRLDISILGPFRVERDGIELNLGPVRQQTVLLALVRCHNHVISPRRLLREVWGEAPPASGVRIIPPYIYRLRNILAKDHRDSGDSVIETRREGYRLRLDHERLDLSRFEDIARRARDSQDAGDPATARMLLGRALGLWSGEPLAGLTGPVAQWLREHLIERWLAAVEQRAELDLALGRGREVVPELTDVVAANPLREPLTRLLMLALHQCDRQAEALDAYRVLRTRLAERTGMHPSRTLRQTYETIVRARGPASPSDQTGRRRGHGPRA